LQRVDVSGTPFTRTACLISKRISTAFYNFLLVWVHPRFLDPFVAFADFRCCCLLFCNIKFQKSLDNFSYYVIIFKGVRTASFSTEVVVIRLFCCSGDRTSILRTGDSLVVVIWLLWIEFCQNLVFFRIYCKSTVLIYFSLYFLSKLSTYFTGITRMDFVYEKITTAYIFFTYVTKCIYYAFF
jgi:hypothetical protein